MLIILLLVICAFRTKSNESFSLYSEPIELKNSDSTQTRELYKRVVSERCKSGGPVVFGGPVYDTPPGQPEGTIKSYGGMDTAENQQWCEWATDRAETI